MKTFTFLYIETLSQEYSKEYSKDKRMLVGLPRPIHFYQ